MKEEKTTEGTVTPGESLTVSKRRLRETAADVEALSEAAAVAGAENLVQGGETLAVASDVDAASKPWLLAQAM